MSETIDEQYIIRRPVSRRRPWRERLFGRPWQPLRATSDGVMVAYRCTYIGGPADGRETLVHETSQWVQVPIFAQTQTVSLIKESDPMPTFRGKFSTITYRRVVREGRPLLVLGE